MEEINLESSEIWMEVPGYEEYFEVSTFGGIRSKKRIVTFKDNRPSREMGGVILKTQLDRCGYPKLRTSIDNTKVNFRVHRVIALTFIPNPENKPQINHLDGNKTNNHVSNLEWCTNSENQIHAIKNGLNVHKTGIHAKRFQRSVEVYKDQVLIDTLYGNADMKLKGYDFRLVSACLKNKRNSHKGCTFKEIK